MTGRLLSREPVITISTIVALLIGILPVFGWSTEVVGAVAGALVVLGGAAEAALVSVDRLLPLLVGIGKAVLAVVIAFGIQPPDNYVSAIMAVLTIVAGLKVRDQVVPPQPPEGDGWRRDVHGVLDTTADMRDTVARMRAVAPRSDTAREDDTQTFRRDPNATHQLDPTLMRGTPHTEDHSGQYEQDWQGKHHADRWFGGRLDPDPGV